MSDNDVQGQVSRLMDICQSPVWSEIWIALDCLLCRKWGQVLRKPGEMRVDLGDREVMNHLRTTCSARLEGFLGQP